MTSAAFSLNEPKAPSRPRDARLRLIEAKPSQALSIEQQLGELARAHGFYSGLYAHIGHVATNAAGTGGGASPLRLAASSPVARQQYGDNLFGDGLPMTAASAHLPFALASIPARGQGRSLAGVFMPVQDHAAGPGLVALIGIDVERAGMLLDSKSAELAFAAARIHVQALIELPPIRSAAVRPTSREIQCLRMVAVGGTVLSIAGTLGIAGRTVEFHLRSVTEKLGAVNRTHAIAIAVASGLIHV